MEELAIIEQRNKRVAATFAFLNQSAPRIGGTMKQPMFRVETDPEKGIRIIVARTDGTQVEITGGQYQNDRSDTERECPKLASLLWRNHRQAQ